MTPLKRFIGFLALAVAPALASTSALAAPSRVDEPASAADVDKLKEQVAALEAEVKALREARSGSGEARSGEPPTADLERKIEALTREIERLRVGEPAEAPVAEKTGIHGLGPAASKVYGVKRGVSFGGYGELLFDRTEGDSTLDFARAILYTGYKFNDSILFNSETEFEHASTETGGAVSVEFAYLDFLWRPQASFRAGLLLLPLGLLNELHEPPIYLGAARPETERHIIPSTWSENGVGVFGESGRLSWRAYVVNSLDASGFEPGGLREGRQNGGEAKANDFAFAGRLDFRPTLGALVGGSLFLGNAGQGEGDFDAFTTLFDVHGEVKRRGLDVRALYARATVGDAAALSGSLGLAPGGTGIASTLQGGYVQVGYDVLAESAWNRQSLIPYLRFEKFLPQSSAAEGYVPDRAENARLVTIGGEWKPIPQVVVKGDWTDRDREEGASEQSFRMALGYIF